MAKKTTTEPKVKAATKVKADTPAAPAAPAAPETPAKVKAVPYKEVKRACDPFNGIVILKTNGSSWKVIADRKGFTSPAIADEAAAVVLFEEKIADTIF